MFTILSCRGTQTMPDGTSAYLNVDTFGQSIQPSVVLPRGSWALVFAGFNNPVNGWEDSATKSAAAMSVNIPTDHVAACLWPGRGASLLQHVELSSARVNAIQAAKMYQPLVEGLLARGDKVYLFGHSCGCWLSYNLLSLLSRPVDGVVHMEAAIRVCEVDVKVYAEKTKKFLNFHSLQDSALRAMRADFVDQHRFDKTFDPTARIVGMDGIACAQNVDLTNIIKTRHSDGIAYPATWTAVKDWIK